MTVKVYVWLGAGTSVGHASMELGNGTYISCWPGEEEEQYDKRSNSVKKDIQRERRKYDRMFMIEELDEEKIQQWWGSFEKTWNPYKIFKRFLYKKNSYVAVMEGLLVGGSESMLNLSAKVYMYYKTFFLYGPSAVVSYCEEICSSYYAVKRNPEDNTYETFRVHNRKPGFIPNFVYYGTVRKFYGVPAEKMRRDIDKEHIVIYI